MKKTNLPEGATDIQHRSFTLMFQRPILDNPYGQGTRPGASDAITGYRLIAAIPVLVLVLSGCSSPESAKALSETDKPILVQTSVASERQTQITIPILGAITTNSRAVLGSEIDGRVVKLLVREGEHVRAGQPLIQLRSDDAKARLDAAKGGLQQAFKAAEADAKISGAKLLQTKLDFTRTQDRLNSEVTLATAKLGEAKANYDRLRRGARPQEIESANADVAGAQLVVESDQTTVDYEKRTLKRKTDLYAEGGISQNEVDQAQVDYDHAVQAMHVAEAQLRSRQLFANLLKEGTPKEEMAQAAAQVSGAAEGLRAARANLASLDEARQAVAVAQADYDRSSARLEQLKAGGQASDEGAKVELAQAALDQTQIRSPIDGVVASLKVVQGQVVRTGQAMAEVASQDGLRMEATALDRDVERIKPGEPVTISLRDDPSRKVEGQVQAVLTPTSDGHTPRIIVSLPQTQGLVAGAVANGEVLTRERHEVLTVPNGALVNEIDSEADVYVVENGQVRRLPVQVVNKSGDRAEIASGLTAGEVVVVDPSMALHDGSKVTVRPK